MIEEKLEKYRKSYIKTNPTEFLVKSGWDDLRVKIASEEQLERKALAAKPGFLSGLIFASLVLLILIPTISFAQNAKEGDFLFPIKVLSDEIVSKVTNSQPKTTPKLKTGQEDKDPIKDKVKEATDGAKSFQENIQKKIEKEVKGIQTKINSAQKKTQNSSNKVNQNQGGKNNPSSPQKKEEKPQNNDQNSSKNNSNGGNQGQSLEKKNN
jgi:hypothetical protein